MNMVTLEEAKCYLRIDSDFEDNLILSLMIESEGLCMVAAGLSASDWQSLINYTPESAKPLTIRREKKNVKEVLELKELYIVAVLYCLGYLYEHRNDTDYSSLILELKTLLYEPYLGY